MVISWICKLYHTNKNQIIYMKTVHLKDTFFNVKRSDITMTKKCKIITFGDHFYARLF